MDQEISQLQRAVAALEERNRRVEADKAWETSLTRRLSVVVLTYAIAVIVFLSIGSARPFLDAFIPVIGYALSVQSLPFLRSAWVKSRRKD